MNHSKAFYTMQRYVKAAVSGAQLSDFTGGVALDPSAAFFEYQQQAGGLFNTIAARSRPVPMIGGGLVPSAAAVGTIVSEGAGIRLSAYSMTKATVTPRKAGALAVVSEESVRADERHLQFAFADLRSAVSKAVDTQCVADLGGELLLSDGDPLTDLAAALGAVAKDGADIVIFCNSVLACGLATWSKDGASPAFPDCGPGGGVICGVPLVITAGLDDDEIMIVDCAGLVQADEGFEFGIARSGSFEMSDGPAMDSLDGTTAAGNLVSMFQTDSLGLRAVRAFGVKAVRPGSVVKISGITYSAGELDSES